MKSRITATACALLLCAGTAVQANPASPDAGRLVLPEFAGLASRATESTEVTVGPWMLHFASHFAGRGDPDGAATRRLLASINGISIHSYEFDQDDAYSMADVEMIRKQLVAPQWQRLMQVRGKDRDNVDMYVAKEDDQAAGLALIASEPRALTVINVIGPINPEDLQRLQTHPWHLDLPGLKITDPAASEGEPQASEAAAD